MHFAPTSHFSAICCPYFYIHRFSQQLLLQAKGRGTVEIPISEVSALDTSGCLQYWKKPSWRSTNLGDNFFWISCSIACPHLSLDFSFWCPFPIKICFSILCDTETLQDMGKDVFIYSPLSVCVSPTPPRASHLLVQYLYVNLQTLLTLTIRFDNGKSL